MSGCGARCRSGGASDGRWVLCRAAPTPRSPLNMAHRKKQLVGLDIDPSGVAVAQVSVNGAVRIERAAFAELEAGVVRDGEVNDGPALTEAIRSIWREHKSLPKQVRIGIANQKIVVRHVELPPLDERKELEAAVRFTAQEQIPMPLENAVLDFHPIGIADTGSGPRQRAVVVAARRDMVGRVLEAVRAAGLRPEGIDLSAFAVVRALHRPAEHGAADEGAQDRLLYLWVGGITNLAVAHETTCLFTRATGGGLETLAVELAERRALTLEHARAWLHHVGLSQPLREVEGDADIVEEARDVLNEGVRRIAGEVRSSLDFQAAYGGAGAVARVLLTGPA